jgi:hypothetical protein
MGQDRFVTTGLIYKNTEDVVCVGTAGVGDSYPSRVSDYVSHTARMQSCEPAAALDRPRDERRELSTQLRNRSQWPMALCRKPEGRHHRSVRGQRGDRGIDTYRPCSGFDHAGGDCVPARGIDVKSIAGVDVFVDEVLAELDATAKDGPGREPGPPSVGRTVDGARRWQAFVCP